MPLAPASLLGQGPDIVLLHGVGVGPETFAELAQLLAVDHRTLVIERPDGGDRAVMLEEQADAVSDTMRSLEATGALVVGVSGGATLALLLAIRHPDVVGGLVVHEPLVGPHAPDLHARFTRAAEHAARGDAEALDVVRSVLGPDTWSALDARTQAHLAAGAPRARAEIPVFAAFSPTLGELASLRTLPVLATVGSRSGPERDVAAAVLSRLAGAAMMVVPGAGNAAQLDAPAALADAIRSWRPTPVGCGG